MSKASEALLTKAASLRNQSEEILNVAREVLAGAGIAEVSEADLIKSAETMYPQMSDSLELASILEKTAQHLDEQNAYCENLEAQIALLQEEHAKIGVVKQAQEDPVLSSLLDSGFSSEDVASLTHVPDGTLQKIASSVRAQNFSLGAESSRIEPTSGGLQAFQAFCLS